MTADKQEIIVKDGIATSSSLLKFNDCKAMSNAFDPFDKAICVSSIKLFLQACLQILLLSD